MIRAKTNASAIRKKYRDRAKLLTGAVGRFLKKSVVAINRKQIENLSGDLSAAPGSYPIPARTGNLRREAGWAIEEANAAFVFNAAAYAKQIHKDRPFLDSAFEEVDVLGMGSREVGRAMAI